MKYFKVFFYLFPFLISIQANAQNILHKSISISNYQIDYNEPIGYVNEDNPDNRMKKGTYKLLIGKNSKFNENYSNELLINAINECKNNKGSFFSFFDFSIPQSARVNSCAYPDGKISVIAFKDASILTEKNEIINPFFIIWKVWGVSGNSNSYVSEDMRQKAVLAAKTFSLETTPFSIINVKKLSE